mgnify:CR=1 FL=1
MHSIFSPQGPQSRKQLGDKVVYNLIRRTSQPNGVHLLQIQNLFPRDNICFSFKSDISIESALYILSLRSTKYLWLGGTYVLGMASFFSTLPFGSIISWIPTRKVGFALFVKRPRGTTANYLHPHIWRCHIYIYIYMGLTTYYLQCGDARVLLTKRENPKVLFLLLNDVI